jgi:hypothetical protein
MKITKRHIGKKVQPECWARSEDRSNHYLLITAVGKEHFLAWHSFGEYEDYFLRSGHMEKADWKIYKPEKKK